LPELDGLWNDDFPEYSVTYNQLYNGNLMNDVKVDDFIKKIEKPSTFPHLSIYYPQNAKFEIYDVFLVVHESKSKQKIIGYQLKEGKSLSKHVPSKGIYKSILIRGDPSSDVKLKMWHVATEDEINGFFGISGEQWTPKKWKELENTVVPLPNDTIEVGSSVGHGTKRPIKSMNVEAESSGQSRYASANLSFEQAEVQLVIHEMEQLEAVESESYAPESSSASLKRKGKLRKVN
jgi:hypothetical protein